MNIVMITTGKRPELHNQTLRSLMDNAAHWRNHTLTIVVDNPWMGELSRPASTLIVNDDCCGASRSRNIGASSIPKYLRQETVMFIDDDVYMLPNWDVRLGGWDYETVVSGHAHPFNHAVGQWRMQGGQMVKKANVLSTVHMLMPWSIWDDVGWFAEPGGPGGSEDVDWCRRATGKGYRFGVTDPMCVVHCGLTSSSGKKIVGYDLMLAMNEALVDEYGISKEKVRFA